MPRNGAPARARLREAALQLYGEKGYETTTTAQIAARAGVTERTYFRHFADKREVLFDGEADLRDALTSAIASAPGELPPLSQVLGAYRAAIPLFVAGRSIAQRRAEVIATSSALQERAYAKAAALTEAVVAALVGRGLGEPSARLAARVGAAVFERAIQAWDGESGAGLSALLDQAAQEAGMLTGGLEHPVAR